MVVARETSILALLAGGIHERLFPPHLELVPQLNEVYELEIAFLESRVLNDDEILHNGAYFARVGDTFTRHFLMCKGDPVLLPQHSSSRLRSFFQANQFKTGYATHGLFPYRGKFHPQMIKGLMNVMGLKPGETVLDPMMGSGTVLLEARLMGIRSVGVDASPFCRFMTQAKLDGLTVALEPLRQAMREADAIFEYFKGVAGQPKRGSKRRTWAYPEEELLRLMEDGAKYKGGSRSRHDLAKRWKSKDVYDFLLLAYLDSAGYAERSNRASPFEQFRSILERYVFVAEKIQRVLAGLEGQLAEAQALDGDARNLPLEETSVDGIIFSPPYSFAIDYLENDSFHLEFMGIDLGALREKMIGLRGESLQARFALYKKDMDAVLAECSRVLRPNRICTVVVGTNNNQLSKLMGIAPDEVQGIDELLVDLAATYQLKIVRKMTRQITGLANVMRNESILMFAKQ